MTTYRQIKNFEFKVEDLRKDEVGYGWVGILGGLNLYINGEEVFSKGFELTSTIRAFHKDIGELSQMGHIENRFFVAFAETTDALMFFGN